MVLIGDNGKPLNKLYPDLKITGIEKNYGYEIGSGNKATCTFISANASYELRNNLFLDASIAVRNYKLVIGAAENTTMYSFGFRWNINKRTFEF